MNDPYRRSALLLHGLNADDRQWILSRLAEGQRAQLHGYLGELEELGMPADRTLAQELLAEGAGAPPARHVGETADFGSALRAASPEAVLRLLGEQPAWLIAKVLGIEAWAWREAIFVGVDASKRERIKQSIEERPPALLARALVADLEARLPEAAAVLPSTAVRPAPWSGLGKTFKRWTRG